MPNQTVTREMILSAALDMTREAGADCVNARSVAARLGRSVQPIYSYFRNMEELRTALYGAGMDFYNAFIRDRADMLSLKSMAAANVEFARREPNLFRMLFLSRLDGFASARDIFDKMGELPAADALAKGLGISAGAAREAYVMMIFFTHGIAAMLSTGGADLSAGEVEGLVARAYEAFTGLAQSENNKN